MANKLLEAIGESSPTERLEQLQDISVSTTVVEHEEDARTAENAFNAQEVIDLARTDLDFLAGLTMPLVFEYCFPPVFISVWIWLLSYVHKTRDFSQLALGLPRGFGKTTLIKIFIIYTILFTKKQFILVVSSTATLAENIISDVIDMLEEPNIKKVFGDWKLGVEKDTQQIKKFGFRGRNIILAGLGAGTSLRGLNIKNTRPDVMIFEDIQTREQADSAVQSDQLEKWMVGTAMKAKSPHGCMFIFVGNMYPTPFSILRKLKSNPTWTKFIAGGILADGTSLWEDLQPIAQLTKEFENDLRMGRPEIFYSEVLNDEHASANNLVDYSKLPEYRIHEDQIPAGNFILIDPSKGALSSDDVAIGYFEVHDTKPVLKKLTSKKISPLETIRVALRYCLENNCRLVIIEGVAYQATLAYWFKYACEQAGVIGIEAVEIYPGGYSKNHRILQMFKMYQAGDVIVHPDLRTEVHLQISQFNPMKTANTDDILDLLAYAPKCIELYGEYMINMGEVVNQEFEGATVVEHNSPF